MKFLTPYNNVMLDLETVGTGPKSAIISIGAVIFDPISGNIGDSFYQAVKLTSSAYYGEIDASTIQWWLKQTPQAQAVFNDPLAKTLKTSLENFTEWLENTGDIKNRKVWGNGPSFDNVILSNAFKAVKLKTPWYFSNDRCVRTILDIGKQLRGFNAKDSVDLEGVAHNALDDAIYQAKYVSAVFQQLKN